MPDQEPFIIPSTDPFKVEATPAKFGGVDARAKRPLDLSGQAVSLSDHLEPIRETPATGREAALLPAEPSTLGAAVRVALPASMTATPSRVSVASGEPMADAHALLPDEGLRAPDLQGPVLQDSLDMRHRERFDDPSRFLRTDTKVRLPSAQPLPRHRAVPTLPSSTSGRILMPRVASSDAGIVPSASDKPNPVMQREAQTAAPPLRAQPDGTPLAAALATLSVTSMSASTPEQRRQSFNQRLNQILSDQQQIGEDLSSVEQAAQLTRAQIHDQPLDGPPQSD
jgi:hypothetical protein